MYEQAIAEMQIRAPAERNRKLSALLEAVNGDMQLKAWWYAQQTTAERLQMSDHSWIHVQIVVNIALRLLRLLTKRGIEPVVVTDHGFTVKDAEVVVTAAALLHDTGMSIHRTDHEAYSLFLAARKLDELLAGIYDEPARSVLASEALHAIIGHRRRGDPFTLEAGIVRVADALDMEQGRSRVPFEANRPNIHSLSAAAIDDVTIDEGTDRAVRIEIEMNNSAGIYQVDELLATKLRGSGLEDHVEVTARIDAEHEKRLVPIFRI
jgi:metal-dependent HD superfamily phosphatase/phosphodiesterase